METRCRRACLALLLAVLAAGAVLLDPALITARTRTTPRISLAVYQCPAGVTEAAASTLECDPIGEGFDVEIVSIENTQPNVTLADAQRDGSIYRWEVEPSEAEIDNWGIRQTALPPGSTAYLVQGETASYKPTALYEFRFTTSEADPLTDLAMFIFQSASQGVIVPPPTEPASEEGQAATETPAETPTQTPEASDPTAASESTPPGNETATATATPESGSQSHARETGAIQELRTIERDQTPLRLAADARSSIVDMLDEGAVVGVLGGHQQIGEGSWYEVQSPENAIGWVEAGAFEAADSGNAEPEPEPEAPAADVPADPAPAAVTFAAGDRAMVIDPPLQLRASGGIDADVIDTLDEGQLLRIDGQATAADGYDWYPVTLLPDTAASGFIAAGFMEPVGLLAGDLVRVEAESANVRAEPSTSADIVIELSQDSSATVRSGPQTADGYDWYEIEVDDGQTGWVAGSLLVLDDTVVAVPEAEPVQADVSSGAFRPGAWVTVIDPPINLRIEPGVEAEAVKALQGGDALVVLGGPEWVDDYNWYHVELDGLQGYTAGEFLGGGFLPGETVRVFDGPVYLRTGPSVDADIVIGLLQDEEVTVFSPEPVIGGDFLWIEVERSDGSTGFVATEFIEPVDE